MKNAVSGTTIGTTSVSRSLSVFLLIVSFGVVASFARYEKKQADFWKAQALQQVAQPYQETQPKPQIERTKSISQAQTPYPGHPANANRYPITLIGEDGSETPLAGKAVHIDLGGKRLFEVDLTAHKSGYLQMWAPARREDPYFNRFVFHPSCANVFYLELVQIKTKGASAGENDPSEFPNDFMVRTAP